MTLQQSKIKVINELNRLIKEKEEQILSTQSHEQKTIYAKELNSYYRILIEVNDDNYDNDDTTYESELVADTSNYDGEWQSYQSNNRW